MRHPRYELNTWTDRFFRLSDVFSTKLSISCSSSDIFQNQKNIIFEKFLFATPVSKLSDDQPLVNVADPKAVRLLRSIDLGVLTDSIFQIDFGLHCKMNLLWIYDRLQFTCYNLATQNVVCKIDLRCKERLFLEIYFTVAPYDWTLTPIRRNC